MKKGRFRSYCFRVAALALMGVFAVLFSMNRSQAAPSGTGVGSLDELKKAVADGKEEIYLTADIVYGKYYLRLEFNDGKKHTLNLNGHDIVMNRDMKRCGIRVSEKTTLTICDTSSEDGDKQGRIRQSGNYYGGGVSVFGEGSTLILESGGISECEAFNGGGVGVSGGATFIMNGGYVELCRASGLGRANDESGNGNGVHVEDGTFTMNGGMIRGNNSGNIYAHNGGAVWVGEKAVFTMNGGSIGDRVVLSSIYGTQGGGNICIGNGAGVYVKGGKFYFNAGTFDSNYCNGKIGGGAIYIAQGSTFEMGKDAVLLANRCNNYGGAIYIDRPKSCVIKGGLIDGQYVAIGSNSSVGGGIYITDNTSQTIAIENLTIKRTNSNTAAGIYVGGGGLKLTGVTISDCSATDNAGGIYAAKNTVVVLNNCTISGCDADSSDMSEKKGLGGAICQAEGSIVNLNGTTLTGNIANKGGAIYLDEDAVCNITDGTITGNKADNYDYSNYNAGAGIYAVGTVKLGGAPVIKDNAQYESDGVTLVRTSNVYLTDNSYIYLIAPLSKNAEVGVWKDGNDRQITDGYGIKSFDTWRTKPSYYFFSDDDSYYAQKDPALMQSDEAFHEVFLMKPKHEHKLTLVPAVKATCASVGTKEYYGCSDCYHIFQDKDGELEYSEELEEVDENVEFYSELIVPKNPKNHVGPMEDKKSNVKAPTCTTNGGHTVTTTCKACGGEVAVREELDLMTGHNLVAINEWDNVPGYGQKCARTGCDYHWFVPKTNENENCQHTSTEKHKEIKPTCVESGMHAHAICNDCGRFFSYNEENDKVDTTQELSIDEINALFVPPLGHTPILENGEPKWYVDEDTVVEPTCIDDGSYDEYTECERCHIRIDQRTIVTPALDHDYAEPYVEDCYIWSKCLRDGCDYFAVSGVAHSLREVDKVEPSCTVDGHEAFYVCTNCGKLMDYESYHTYSMPVDIDYQEVVIPALGHSYGEWKMLFEPTASSKGIEIRYCERCDAFEVRDMDTEVTYSFTKGSGSEWKNGSTGTLGFTVKRSYKDEETFEKWFTGEIYVDDTLLTDKDASTSKGSVNIDLKDSFLNTLEVGEHTITVVFEDAEVSAKFKVTEADKADETEENKEATVTEKTIDTGSPATGDNAPIVPVIIIAAVSAVALSVCLILKAKKKKRSLESKDSEKE